MPTSKACFLFAGSSHPELAESIAKQASMRRGKVQIETFPDGEIGIRILEKVHGQDVFVLQTIARHPNLYLMELFIMIDALKRAGARRITLLIPYFGYGRQDRRQERGEPLSAKLVAQLLETSGASEVITMDLHALQIEGFFNIPSVHLSAETAFAEVIQNEGWQSSVIIAPDVGSIRRAKNLAQHLNTSDGFVDKHRMSAKQVESHALIGHVRQQNVVLVDDLISTCQTVLTAAHICRAAGAKKIRVVATHALFVNSMFEEDVIEKIVVTDTVPLKTTSKRVKVVSVAPIFTKSIHDLLS